MIEPNQSAILVPMNNVKEIINEEIKLVNQLINPMILILIVLSSLALLFTLLRTELTGWGAKENTLIILYLLMLLVTAIRHKIHTYIKVTFFTLSLLLVAVMGVFEFGFMAPAILFLPMTALLLSLFCTQAFVLLFASLVLIFIAWVGYAFNIGYFSLTPDANTIFNSVDHWLVYLVCLACLMLFVPVSIFKYRNTMSRLFLEVKQQKQDIEHLANHDFLTGLPLIKLCMLKFDEFLTKNDLANQALAVLFLDVDQFKLVLDRYGHDAGDICLMHVASQLKKAIKSEGFVCRLGGDEFMVLLSHFNNNDELLKRSERIISEVSSPFVFRGQQLSIGVSVGIALYGVHGQKFHDLKRAADRAMYQAKISTHHSICFAELEGN